MKRRATYFITCYNLGSLRGEVGKLELYKSGQSYREENNDGNVPLFCLKLEMASCSPGELSRTYLCRLAA